MIVGVNAVGTRHSGAETVLRSLITGFADAAAAPHVSVFCGAQAAFPWATSSQVELRRAPQAAENPLLRYLWLGHRFATKVAEAGCDVILNMNNMAGRPGVPQILFIQQSLFFSDEAMAAYPNDLSARSRIVGLRQFWTEVMRRSAARSERVVVQTVVMRDTVCERLGISPAKVVVIPPAVPRIEPDRKCHGSCDPDGGRRLDILYVGSSRPYKNLSVLASVAAMAIKERKAWRFDLTTGTVPGCPLENSEYHGTVDRERLAALYRSASVLVMPSLVETVGLPLLEAMSCGVPVLAADRPYAREICGEAALYFDPGRPEELYACLERLESDGTLRTHLRRAGFRQLRRFPDNVMWSGYWHSVLLDLVGGSPASTRS